MLSLPATYVPRRGCVNNKPVFAGGSLPAPSCSPRYYTKVDKRLNGIKTYWCWGKWKQKKNVRGKEMAGGRCVRCAIRQVESFELR